MTNPDPRLRILVDLIDADIKHLNDRIKRTGNVDQFSGDHCAARYLEGVFKQFIVQCVLRGLPDDIDRPCP